MAFNKAYTQVTPIVRRLAGRDATIFNDRLVDGRRSVKVWGWERTDYERAQVALQAAGLEAVVVDSNYKDWKGAVKCQPRLYVTE